MIIFLTIDPLRICFPSSTHLCGHSLLLLIIVETLVKLFNDCPSFLIVSTATTASCPWVLSHNLTRTYTEAVTISHVHVFVSRLSVGCG